MSLNKDGIKAMKEMSKTFKELSELYEKLAKCIEDLDTGIISQEEFEINDKEIKKELLYHTFNLQINEDINKFL